MAKRRTKGDHEKALLVSAGYEECAGCGKMLRPGTRRCPACGALTRSSKSTLKVAAVVAIVILALASVYVFYPREEQDLPPPTVVAAMPTGYGASTAASITVSFNRAMDVASVESAFVIVPSVSGTFSWSGYAMTFNPVPGLPDDSFFTATIGSGAKDLSGEPLDCGVYSWSFSTADLPTVRRSIGSGSGDFWTTYPATHPSSGLPVNHPDWVVAALAQGAVLILDHSEGCYPCVQQMDICQSAYASNPELQYFDVLSGTDEPEASEAFAAYDPDDGMHYVPLTILVTRALDGSGGEVIAWHSWEGVVDLITLTSWIDDARSHYDECV